MKHTKKGQLFTEIVLEVFKLNGQLVSEGDRLMKEFDLSTVSWKVLGALALAESPLTVPQIARKMGQTRQGIQRITDVLEKRGLLRYQTNPDHKRSRLIALTDQGKNINEKLDQKQTPWANSISENSREQDLSTTISVLQNLNRELESQ
ncbi:MAG: MarR family transcriptional regulator [Proteobacteria bacterium]|nr:MarR family transcriptional regulator [Pseudomonadota bacterium]